MEDYPKVRRRDREATDIAFYKQMLEHTAQCSIALCDAQGGPYVNSNFFLYNEGEDALYFHTAGNGYTKTLLQQNNKVCISVSRMGRLYPAKRALDFGTEYYSVTIFGSAEIVKDEQAVLQFFNCFLQKYFKHISPNDYSAPTLQDAMRATVYKATINHWTAKVHEVDEAHPGAIPFSQTV